MRKTLLAAVVTIALAAVVLTGAPDARADVGISIGIPLPGVAFYAPPPPVYYAGPAYYPRAYYAPPAYYGYGPAYGSVYFGRTWRGGHRHGWHGRGHRHGYRHRW